MLYARPQGCLDAEAHARLEELVKTFHRKRGPILGYVMQWGLSHSKDWTIDQAIPAATKPVPVLLGPELLQQVQDAAAIHGVSMAAWLRQAGCQVTINDFPASWHAGETAGRCHESGYYQRKFRLRLDHGTSQKLEALRQALHRPAADVIHQLVAQATPEDFPPSWQLAVGEPRQHEVQLGEGE